VIDNPTRAAIQNKNLALARMPRCNARTRSGGQCLGMRMANGQCRMHGGASPGAPRGEGNGMFRHGLRSIEAIERRRKMTAELRAIADGQLRVGEPRAQLVDGHVTVPARRAHYAGSGSHSVVPAGLGSHERWWMLAKLVPPHTTID
jgi:hypothetical protein